MSGCFVKIESEEAPWNSGAKIRGRQHGPPPGASRAATSRCRRSTRFQDMRTEMCLILESLGIPVEVHHHEVAGAGQNEIGTRFSTLVQRADWTAAAEVRDPERRARLRQDRDLHAQAGRRRQRLAACTCTSRCGRTARTCSPATATPACREFALFYIGGIIKHARALNAITNPGTNSYKRLVPGFEAPVKLAYSRAQPLGVDPHSARRQPQGPAHRGALPGSDCATRTWRSPRC